MYLVVGKKDCPFCDDAMELLENKGEEFLYVDIESEGANWKNFLVDVMEVKTVPQVFEVVGGFHELKERMAND